MTLNFAETSPGVHMAQLEDSSKGIFRTIVIIESLGKFTLYVDGEVALRDLPTFEAAASQADVILTKKGSRRMVQVATALVLLSVIGGTAVGAVNLLSGSSPMALASAAQTAIAGTPRTESAVASRSEEEQPTASDRAFAGPGLDHCYQRAKTGVRRQRRTGFGADKRVGTSGMCRRLRQSPHRIKPKRQRRHWQPCHPPATTHRQTRPRNRPRTRKTRKPLKPRNQTAGSFRPRGRCSVVFARRRPRVPRPS